MGLEHAYVVDNRPMFVAPPGLYLGSFDAETNLPALLGSGITHVLTVGAELIPSYPKQFTYLHVPALDHPSENLLCRFPEMFAFIEEGLQSGGVLVHCLAGVSRSATVVIGYLMWKNILPFHQARRHVAAVRPWIRPNSGFEQQLLAFEDAGCKLPGQGQATISVRQNAGCKLPRREASSCSVVEGFA